MNYFWPSYLSISFSMVLQNDYYLFLVLNHSRHFKSMYQDQDYINLLILIETIIMRISIKLIFLLLSDSLACFSRGGKSTSFKVTSTTDSNNQQALSIADNYTLVSDYFVNFFSPPLNWSHITWTVLYGKHYFSP